MESLYLNPNMNEISNSKADGYSGRKNELDNLLEDIEDYQDSSKGTNKIESNKISAIHVDNGSYQPNNPTNFNTGQNAISQNKVDRINVSNNQTKMVNFEASQVEQDLNQNQLHDVNLSNDDYYNFGGPKIENNNVINIQDNDYEENERNDFGYDDYNNHLDDNQFAMNQSPSKPLAPPEPVDSPKQFNLNDFLEDDFGPNPSNNAINTNNHENGQKEGIKDEELDDVLQDLSF